MPLNFVPEGTIENISALVQILARRLAGNKPLFEPTMVNLRTQICVIRPQYTFLLISIAIALNQKCFPALYIKQYKHFNKTSIHIIEDHRSVKSFTEYKTSAVKYRQKQLNIIDNALIR